MTSAAAPLADAGARRLIASDLDATLIVEAAAGTGKTTELVGRIVRVLAEGRARVGEIVAVTFTEKAAGELKLRLRERLDRERTAAAGDDEKRQRLGKALMGLEEAHVSTIHGFCADLLRERPVEAGVDPLFEVLTEPASAALFERAFSRWLQQQLDAPPPGVRRALRRSASGGDEGPVDRLRAAAWELAQWRDFEAPWSRPAFDRTARIDEATASLHALAALTRDPASRNDPLCTSTEPVRRVSEEIALTQHSGEPVVDADYDAWEAALVDLCQDRALRYVKQGRGAMYKPGVARSSVLEALEGVRAQLEGLRMDADADLAALLKYELQGALDMYAQAKAAAGALDFLDLLLLARDLVRGNPAVRRGFQERFKRIFVDEFQDTDPLQAEILLLLAADDPAETDWRRARPVPGRLFLVGDPKQSIYRFRRADVGIYQEVCRQLVSHGATAVHLNTSFRSVPGIQACVNAAFEPVMTGDATTLQAAYVPLAPFRPALAGQPSVVALPVPSPYAIRNITAQAIDASLPAAVGALVDWIVHDSGWMVTERTGSQRVPVTAKHICLLFRRFISWRSDVTRPYVEALEARGVPHVLVGGRAFHEREEIEAIRAALSAIEWPDDELSVFATLRGPLFAVTDALLLEWAHRFGRATAAGFRRGAFHPFRVPPVFLRDTPAELEHLRPIAGALGLLRRLHRHRNRACADEGSGREWGGIAAVLHELFAATRAHVALALRRGGEQALANVLYVSELARQYEGAGGLSFRGFIDELHIAADRSQAMEAPILEEDSDGVRMMTVHKAKGLEFPIAILADLTCRLSRAEPGRWIDPDARLCAIRLAGWAPTELLHHGYEESARDHAEGQRLAYVAATRARDVLVVPVVGDEPYEGGWLDPLIPAIYPPLEARRRPAAQAAGCPAFRSSDSVVHRPDEEPARAATVAPGTHRFGGYDVVWWDPHVLALDAPAPIGLRRDDLIVRDGEPAGQRARLEAYRQWQAARESTVAAAGVQSIVARTATELAASGRATVPGEPPPIEILDIARTTGRPAGRAFGALVHSTLATVPLDADDDLVRRVAATQGRIFYGNAEGAGDEAYAAAEVVSAVLRHPLFDRVRAANRAGRAARELPVIWRSPDGLLVEGTVDLLFEEQGEIVVLDFKTDRELDASAERYRRQLGVYCSAIADLRGRPVRGILMRI